MAGHVPLKILWNKKRLIVRLVAILIAVLACSYRPLVDRFHSMKRRGEIGKILNEPWKTEGPAYSKHYFRIRGPLTIAQVETELFGRPLDSSDITRTYESTATGKAWGRIKSNYNRGDELYFFTSDKRSWAGLMGEQGYVLFRKNEVVARFVTVIN